MSVLSSDDESNPSETTLDDICESLKGNVQDIFHIEAFQIERRYPPFWFDRIRDIRDIQHNIPSVRFGNTHGKFEKILSSIVSRNIVPFNIRMITEASHIMTLGWGSAHVGTLHGAEAR